MPIATACSACGSRVTAPDGAAGHRLPCPKCREPVTVPAIFGLLPAEGQSTRPDAVAALLAASASPITPPAATQPDDALTPPPNV